ncbi:MAG: hypothetical protein JWQ09_2158 [Segetibacter sp.]|nr:hypothetical protein [Segetibacter sp.]
MEKDIPSEKEELELSEQKLKVQELKLKIKELKRPDYLRLNFWTSAFAVLIALGGVIAQNYLSTIKNELAKKEMSEALEKKESALQVISTAERQIAETKKSLSVATDDYNALLKQRDSVKKTIDEINKKVNELDVSNKTPQVKLDTSLKRVQLDKIKMLANKAQTEINSLPPRVYIQISGEDQRQVGKTVQSKLLQSGYLAPGVENIKGKANIPSKTEVRYYRDEEIEEASRIVHFLKDLKLGIEMRDSPVKVPGSGRGTRPRHYEIWFSPE